MYRLLIADDEELERSGLQAVVENSDLPCEVVSVVDNGRQAIEYTDAHRVDIAILDINMPGIDGIEAARIMKERQPSMRIVFLTAFDYFEYAHEAIRLGADDYLVKPSNDAELIDVLKRILSRIEIDLSTTQRLMELVSLVKADLESNLAVGTLEASRLSEFFALENLPERSFLVCALSLHFEMHPFTGQKTEILERLQERLNGIIVCTADKNDIKLIGNRNLSAPMFVLILPKQISVNQAQDEAVSFLSTVKDVCEQELLISFQAGISEARDKTETAANLPAQAREALVHSSADNPIILTRFSPNTDSARPGKMIGGLPPRFEQRLAASVLNADTPGALRAFNDALKWFSLAAADGKELGHRLVDLFALVRHSVFKQYPKTDSEDSSLYDSLLSASNASTLRRTGQCELDRLIEHVKCYATPSFPAGLKSAIEYIERNYREELHLNSVAEHCRLSVYHVSRLFRRYTGKGFIEYLNNTRIQHAKELLDSSPYSIKEISTLIGYSDPNYFSRAFKRLEGVSPSEYRDNISPSGLLGTK